jgi:amino acid transporter
VDESQPRPSRTTRRRLMARDLWHRIVGPPLRPSERAQEEITAPEGLAALSLDALSSVAYGPQALMAVLATAGTAALGLTLPLTLAVVGLLAILVLSYTQVIEAYPDGGGAYAVSRANLGLRWARWAAAALVVDYVLTVAVSVAAGVAALTSAFPALQPFTLPLNLGLLALLTLANLRGVGESARAFLLPAFVFLGGMFAILGLGVARAHAMPLSYPPTPRTVGTFLLLKAFAAGCSALTGVEAIANGVPLFRSPRVRRAKQTEYLLGLLLSLLLLGTAYLAVHLGARPNPRETVLSQIMARSVGRTWLYYLVSLAVTTVLGLAANTSYGGLPLLLSILAQDDCAPHLFAVRGDRAVYQYGVWLLTVLAASLLVASGGNTDALVPLYAIGVFLGFTLSQAGLVVHHLQTRPRAWVGRTLLNGLGTLVTATATLIFSVAKFTEGAWLVVVVIPLLYLTFGRIRHHYRSVAQELGIGEMPPPVLPRPCLVVVPVHGISRLTQEALAVARSLSSEVVAAMVVFSAEEERQMEAAWQAWNPGVRLVTLRSLYPSVVRPLVRFVSGAEAHGHPQVLVLVPQVVTRHLWQAALHNQLGSMVAAALRRQSGVLVATLPVRVLGEDRRPSPGSV